MSDEMHEAQELWYRHPARRWVEALPIGNGCLGGMVFGGTAEDRVALNEHTLWSGGPREHLVPNAVRHLPEVRRLIFEGKSREAQALIDAAMMPSVPGGKTQSSRATLESQLQSYLPLADLFLRFPGHESVQDYRRSLDLNLATAAVTYRANGHQYTREYFASYPDNLIVIHLTTDAPAGLNCQISFDCPHSTARIRAIAPNTIELAGQLGPRHRPNPVPFGAECDAEWHGSGLEFASRMQVRVSDGLCVALGNHIAIPTAKQATLLISAATSFVSPTDITGNPKQRIAAVLAAVQDRSYATIRADHIADHQRLFQRVKLSLGQSPAAELPTDQRIQLHGKGGADAALAALFFDYGRYLLIASSRPGGLPATLQGLWNDLPWPPWGSKWTLNINTEMNYWPAESTALSECHEPLFDLIESLVEPGRRTAREHYGCGGFVVHHNTDLWRGTGPVDHAIHTWPMSAGWLCLHLWERYQFDCDREFLARRAYPLMKEAARFLADFVVEAPPGVAAAGRLVTNPSMSPENEFHRPNGSSGVLTYGATMDLSIIRALLSACITAAGELQLDEDLRVRWQQVLDRLAPLQIGRHGQLQEWIEDLDDPADHHRHSSHLFAVYPGNQITPRRTPELAHAARRSLELRGDGGTGWSLAWKIGLWSRLGDGDHAHALLRRLLSPAPEMDGDYDEGAGVYPNLFDAHPPFQIDGNFGATAAIAEMLLQSHDDEIDLLPALPCAWPTGQARGLRARGGIIVDLKWHDGALVCATLHAPRDASVRVRFGEQVKTIELSAGSSATCIY
jgi:alpha-L-fucosidase 2